MSVKPKEGPDLIRFGAFEADRATGELRKAGRRIHLQEQPFRILLLLLEQPGEVVSRAELQEKIWGATFVDFEEGLNTAVRKLRDALGGLCYESPVHRNAAPKRLPVYSPHGSCWRRTNPSGTQDLTRATPLALVGGRRFGSRNPGCVLLDSIPSAIDLDCIATETAHSRRRAHVGAGNFPGWKVAGVRVGPCRQWQSGHLGTAYLWRRTAPPDIWSGKRARNRTSRRMEET